MGFIGPVGGVVALALVFYLGPAIAVYLMISKLSAPVERLQPVAPDERPDMFRQVAAYDGWAGERGFVWQGAYTHMGAFIAAWVHQSEPTFFCVYIIGAEKRATDLVTELTGGHALTAGKTKDGLLFPWPPEGYKQVLTNTSLDERWQAHRDALDYLRDRFGFGMAPGVVAFELAFLNGVRKDAQHVRTLALWPLRWPYYYFVRRNRLKDRTVRDLVEAGEQGE